MSTSTPEQDWLVATDPAIMLRLLGGKTRERKFRHFACACGLRALHLIPDETGRALIQSTQDYADGLRSWEEFASFWDETLGTPCDNAYILSCCRRASHPDTDTPLGIAIGAAAFAADAVASVLKNENAVADDLRSTAAWIAEQVVQSKLLRCIFGNPFRPVVSDSTWHTPTAVSLAHAIYAEKAFDRLPVLADALEEAGCHEPEILAHCRQSGPHACGCWVIDLVLGKK